MKRRILYWLFCVVLTNVAWGEVGKVSVMGKVMEEGTAVPIEMATVQLLTMPDSTQAAGIVTKQKGMFVLPTVKPGKYLLKVSFIGYASKFLPVHVSEKEKVKDVGTIQLKVDAVLLHEAVVVAEAPPVTMVADTTEFNAAAYRVPEGSMLEELIKKIPGAEISDDGKITLNGKDIRKILVDGKEFFSDDPKIALKNLPVNIVQKVRAYDKKSDQAMMTGIDDGEEEAVLDLSIKPGMRKGWFGNIIAGYGSEKRYEAGVMASNFKNDGNISIIGTANNTNNKGFSEFGDAGQGMSNGDAGSGITEAQSIGLNFEKETKKVNVGGNVQYGHSVNDARRKNSSETFLGEESSFGEGMSKSLRDRHDVRFNMRLEWKIDSLTTLIFRPSGSYSKTSVQNSNGTSTRNNDFDLINTRKAATTSDSRNYSLNGSIMLFKKFKKKGRNLHIGGRFGMSDSETDNFSESEAEFFGLNADYEMDLDSTSVLSRYTDKDKDSRNWSVSASYAEPIFNKHYLELRYKFSHRKQTAQSLVYDSINVYIDYLNRGYDDWLSNRVENFYNTHETTLSLRGIYPKLMYSAGVSVSPQSSLSKTLLGPNSNRELPKQHVLNWAPSVMLRYKFSDRQILMFRYHGRSQEPNIENLQEIIDITNPMRLRYGNPNLKPAFDNSFSLMYNNFDKEHMRSYSLHMFYSNVRNSIANRMTYNPKTGARTYHKENVNGNWNTRAYFGFNTPFKNKKFTISTNTRVKYEDAVSYTTVARMQAEQELSTTHNLGLGQKVNANYRCDVFDVSLKTSIHYNWVRNTKQANSNRETFDYYVGGSTNITLPWQIFLSTDVNCRFKDGYSTGMNNNEIIWNAQLSKSFLKNNAATIRFKIYDILHQQTNLSRSISETQMNDVEYNTLGSYFMVHFVYRFNSFGGKQGKNNSRQQMKGGYYRGYGHGGYSKYGQSMKYMY